MRCRFSGSRGSCTCAIRLHAGCCKLFSPYLLRFSSDLRERLFLLFFLYTSALVFAAISSSISEAPAIFISFLLTVFCLCLYLSVAFSYEFLELSSAPHPSSISDLSQSLRPASMVSAFACYVKGCTCIQAYGLRVLAPFSLPSRIALSDLCIFLR